MRFVRYFVMAFVITICCACAAFAYSPGDGYQDVVVDGVSVLTGTSSSSFTFAFRAVVDDTVVDSVSGSTGGSDFSLSVPASLTSYMFDSSLGGFGSPYNSSSFYSASSCVLTIPLDCPLFLYSSGVLSGTLDLTEYNANFLSDDLTLQFVFSDVDGSVIHTSSVYSISYRYFNSTVSFSVDAPSVDLCSVSSVIISYPTIGTSNKGLGISNFYLANGDISVDDLPAPDPPSSPEYGGSIGSFSVSTSASGQYTHLMYYEDIVNGLYNAAIAAEAYSLSEYPYNTVMSYRGSDGYMYYVLIVTDHPFISSVEVAMEYINYGTYDYGFSSQVYICRVPLGSLTGGTYTFWAMSQYSAISAVEFLENLANSVPFPSADMTADDFYLSSPICALMSYESGDPVLYTMGTNYAVAYQNTSGRVYLKQAFKFADSWAYLLLQAGNEGSADVGYILNQILESLRSDDGSSTVYIRLNQIYELLNNNTGLPADSPIVGAIDQSSANLNTFMENDMQLPDMSEVGNLSAALTPVFDNIFSSLGVISVLTMIGLVLGVIKLVLQR